MTLSEESDVQLVQRFKNGDSDAFDAIVCRFQDPVCRLAATWLYDHQHTADVAQEVFIRSFKGLRSFRFRSTPFTWLYRTTKNVCHEFNRKRRTESLEPEQEPIDPAAGPEKQLGAFEAARRVRQLVAVLPERQREVVILRVFEELSVKEAALAMGCREGTVKALLHKAINRLKISVSSQEQKR